MAENEHEQIGLMETLYDIHQVWCVAYDSPNPSMDGRPHPLRMADQDYEIALRNYEFLVRQQRVSPKRNLRIETRWVSDYMTAPVPHPAATDVGEGGAS